MNRIRLPQIFMRRASTYGKKHDVFKKKYNGALCYDLYRNMNNKNYSLAQRERIKEMYIDELHKDLEAHDNVEDRHKRIIDEYEKELNIKDIMNSIRERCCTILIMGVSFVGFDYVFGGCIDDY